jgi:hypothetical protein
MPEQALWLQEAEALRSSRVCTGREFHQLFNIQEVNLVFTAVIG